MVLLPPSLQCTHLIKFTPVSCLYFLPCVWYKTLGKSQHGYPSLSSTDFCPLLIYNINRLLYDMLIKFECKLSEKKKRRPKRSRKKKQPNTQLEYVSSGGGLFVCFFILSFVGIFSNLFGICFSNRGKEKETELLKLKLKSQCKIV